MKTASLFLIPAVAMSAAAKSTDSPPASGEPASVVRFVNSDRLAGTLDSLTPEWLLWKSPALEKTTPFFLNKVMELTLPNPPIPEIKADHEAIVTLSNGDTIRGQLASVTDEKVSLDTWFAGRMDFNRLMVTGVTVEPLSMLFYRGPVGLDGWVQQGKTTAWSYDRGAFRSKSAGSIGRADLLPEECSISFDAAWRGDSFNFKAVFFAEEPGAEGMNSGYEVSFQRGSIYLRNLKTQQFLGNAQGRELLENDRIHVEIRASTKSGKICLFINERLAEVWVDPDREKGQFGKALQFVATNTLPVRISGIKVAPWDGVVDQAPEPNANVARVRGFADMEAPKPEKEEPKNEKEAPKADRMQLANGDSVAGEAASIRDGVIHLKTSLGEIKLPVSRIRNVALKPVEQEVAIRRNGDVRASFPDGSSIVFRLDQVDGDKITGSSQNFGTAVFQISAFDRIQFNIHDPNLKDVQKDDDW